MQCPRQLQYMANEPLCYGQRINGPGCVLLVNSLSEELCICRRCVKAMIGESCHMEKQAKPLSYLSLSWGLGTILGPSLGGLLSRPCSSFGHDFPLCHSGQLFDSRCASLVQMHAAFALLCFF